MPEVSVTVLGTAQDGGFPQPGCQEKCCFQNGGSNQRYPVSLGIIGIDGTHHLIEASRMMGEQFRIWQEAQGQYPPKPTSISLTHAHLGHIDGLGLLGKEVMGAKGVVVHCSESMDELIRKTPAYQELIHQGTISTQVWADSNSFEPSPGCGFSIRPVLIPHRSELSDNHALIIEGARQNILFMPDHDCWEDTLNQQSIREWLSNLNVNTALIDGTFWDSNELQHRDMSEIPHPPVQETLERLGLREDTDPEILFFHLNHTNPLCQPNSKEHEKLQSLGWAVATEGDSFTLERL